MSVKWKTKKNKFPDMIREAEALNGKKLKVGFLRANISGLRLYMNGAVILSLKTHNI